MPQMRRFASLQIILTTSAHYNTTKKCFVWYLFSNEIETLCDSCELAPAVPSLPPCQPHRDNRPRSHPPHFALTAPCHPTTTSVNRNAEACPHHRVFKLSESRPVWDKEAVENKSKAAILIGHTGSFSYRSTFAHSPVRSHFLGVSAPVSLDRAGQLPVTAIFSQPIGRPF